MEGHLGNTKFDFREEDNYVNVSQLLDDMGKDESLLFDFLNEDETKQLMNIIIEKKWSLPPFKDGKYQWVDVEDKGYRTIYWLQPTLATALITSLDPLLTAFINSLNHDSRGIEN